MSKKKLKQKAAAFKEIIKNHPSNVFLLFAAFIFTGLILSQTLAFGGISGFSAFLPAEETIFYGEIELPMPNAIQKRFEEEFKVNWEEEIAPWVGDRIAFALIQNGDEIQRAAFFQMAAQPESKRFEMLSDMAALSEKKFSAALPLNQNPYFTRIRKNLGGKAFFYGKPAAFEYFGLASPLLDMQFSKIGAAFDENTETGAWEGRSYGILAFPSFIPQPAPPYRARLLSLLPDEFEFIFSGYGFAQHAKNIERFIGVNIHGALQKLFDREFALLVDKNDFLFIGEPPSDLSFLKKNLRDAVSSLAVQKKQITLPDGTIAQELVPDPESIQDIEDRFNNISISGITYGEQKEFLGYAEATDMLYLSNNRTLLKKALLTASEPRRSFRESESYKTLLQPILQNPELLGIAKDQFGFSKRMFEDHMEANFVIMGR